jgi:hypothetical protein
MLLIPNGADRGSLNHDFHAKPTSFQERLNLSKSACFACLGHASELDNDRLSRAVEAGCRRFRSFLQWGFHSLNR